MEGTLKVTEYQPLPWTGLPPIRSGCPEPRLTWPGAPEEVFFLIKILIKWTENCLSNRTLHNAAFFLAYFEQHLCKLLFFKGFWLEALQGWHFPIHSAFTNEVRTILIKQSHSSDKKKKHPGVNQDIQNRPNSIETKIRVKRAQKRWFKCLS